MAEPFSVHDLHCIAGILAAAARAELMPRFGRLREAQIRQKSSAFDIVTAADEAAEMAITAGLRAAFPNALVIGEESAERDGSLLERIPTAELAILVDPLDGTKNFASNLPVFGVMAAVTARGRVLASVIHDPISKDSAFALLGGGAWMERETGERSTLQVARPVPFEEMEGVIGSRFLPEPLRTTVSAKAARLAGTTLLRCAAHEYRMAASGHCHLLLYYRLLPWDHAPGWLLHKEAGGYSAHFDGMPYVPSNLSGGLICAPDRASWQLARGTLLGL